MTRFTKLLTHHRAAVRRAGVPLDIDREEGKEMAEALLAGDEPEVIAKRHGVSAAKVQRRLFTMGLYRLVSTGVGRR